MDLFFECLEHRADYICKYQGEALEIMSRKLIHMLEQTDSLLSRKIELVAVLYKWGLPDFKENIFNRLISLAKNYKYSESLIIAICNFIWINNKVFSFEQKKQAKEILDNWLDYLPNSLIDTIQHTLHSLKVDYITNAGRAKIVLFIPEFLSGLSFLQPPIDFMKMVATLRQYEICADIFDNRAWHYSEQQVMNYLGKYDIIVLNTTPIDQVQNYFVDYRYSLTIKLIKMIKSFFPSKTLIVCGSHGSVRCDLLEKYGIIDIIVLGEYEDTCVKLVKSLADRESINNLPNLSILEGKSYYHTHSNDETLHPLLKEDVYPDYGAVDLLCYYGNVHYKGINVKKLHWSIIMTSRGCPYQCVFCYKFFGSKIRRHSVSYIMQELRIMHDHKIDGFFIIDQLFTSDKLYVKELCNHMIEEELHFSWTCQTRVDCLDEEVLQIMIKAGCTGIWLGVESVTDNILSLNKKGTTREQIINCISLLKRVGLSFNVFFMLGMPGETKESLLALYDFLKTYKLPCTKSFMICTPRFGTPLYDWAENEHRDYFKSFNQLNDWKGLIFNNVSNLDIQRTIQQLSNLIDENNFNEDKNINNHNQ